MTKKNEHEEYAPDTQLQANTLAIVIMQERFKNVETNIEDIKKEQKAGFTEIKDMLGHTYVTTQQHERLVDRVAAAETREKEQGDIMKLIRNIVITSITVGLLALLGYKAL